MRGVPHLSSHLGEVQWQVQVSWVVLSGERRLSPQQSAGWGPVTSTGKLGGVVRCEASLTSAVSWVRSSAWLTWVIRVPVSDSTLLTEWQESHLTHDNLHQLQSKVLLSLIWSNAAKMPVYFFKRQQVVQHKQLTAQFLWHTLYMMQLSVHFQHKWEMTLTNLQFFVCFNFTRNIKN